MLYVVDLFPLPREYYCNPRRKEGDFGLPPKKSKSKGGGFDFYSFGDGGFRR